MIEILSLIVAIIGIIIVPLIVYSFKQYGKCIKLETEIVSLKDFHKEYKQDISKLFQKIDDLKDDFHKSLGH